MNFCKSSILVAALAMGFAFTSCDNDDDLIFSGKPVADAQMRTALKSMGYQFNDEGNLLMDAKVAATDSLDLSGSKLTDLSDLVLFPNLKYVDLSNNGYGPVYDFANLPKNIEGVDLTGNEIYDFEGLVDAKVENDEVKTTILRKLTGLQLPATAKWNVEDLMPFYMQNKAEGTAVNMTMADENGEMKAYTTLREVPDTHFRTFLKQSLPKIFTSDDKIDISKPVAKMDMANFQLQYLYQFEHLPDIKSIEGIEYVINNPYYPENYVVFGYEDVTAPRQFSVGYVMPRSNIKGLWLTQTTTKGLDLSKATSLVNLRLTGNENLVSLDLSKTLIANQDYKAFDHNLGNLMNCNNCKNLESIIFPDMKNGGVVSGIELRDLPSLKKLDCKSIHGMGYLTLLKLGDCKIVYPELTHVYANMAGEPTLEPIANTSLKVTLAVSQDVFDKGAETFIRKYREVLTDGWLHFRKVGAIRWIKLVD